MKYIDADKLLAEIERRIETYKKGYANGDDCRADALEVFLHDLSFLDTLQEPEIDFEQELYNRFGMVKDFTLGMRIAQCFYNLGRESGSSEIPNDQEPEVDLEKEVDKVFREGAFSWNISYSDMYGIAERFYELGRMSNK